MYLNAVDQGELRPTYLVTMGLRYSGGASVSKEVITPIGTPGPSSSSLPSHSSIPILLYSSCHNSSLLPLSYQPIHHKPINHPHPHLMRHPRLYNPNTATPNNEPQTQNNRLRLPKSWILYREYLGARSIPTYRTSTARRRDTTRLLLRSLSIAA